jgi:hypothetical protein
MGPYIAIGLSVAAGAGVLWWLRAWWLAFVRDHRSRLRDYRRDDMAAIAAASAKVGDAEKIAVVQNQFGRELDRVSVISVRYVAVIAIVEVLQVLGNVAVGVVNGASLTFPGVPIQTLSLCIAAVPTLAVGLSSALLWQTKKAEATKAMEDLRLEIWHFVGGTLAYQGLSSAEAWQIVNQRVANILRRYFSGGQAEPESPGCENCDPAEAEGVNRE